MLSSTNENAAYEKLEKRPVLEVHIERKKGKLQVVAWDIPIDTCKKNHQWLNVGIGC